MTTKPQKQNQQFSTKVLIKENKSKQLLSQTIHKPT